MRSKRPSLANQLLTSRYRWTILSGLFLLVAAFVLPTILPEPFHYGNKSAHFYFVTPTDGGQVGHPFTIELHVVANQPVNAVGTLLTVDPNVLQITEMTTDQSFCSFYPENTFDTIKGEVHIECGTPNPGFSGDSAIFRITVQPIAAGTTKLKLDRQVSQALANDGKGTNILSIPSDKTISIQNTF